MKKTILIFMVLLIQGCSPYMSKHYAYYKYIWDDSCPRPSSSQIDKSGAFNITKGEVLKCQIQMFTSNMSCQGITDSTDADGLICNNGEKTIMFLFNEQGIMTHHKIF